MAVPKAEVALTEVTLNGALPATETFPTAPVPTLVVTLTSMEGITVTVPTDPVAATPITVLPAKPTTVTLPIAPVAVAAGGTKTEEPASAAVPVAPVALTPVTSTGIAEFHAPWPQVPLPQPVNDDTATLRYAILIIALLASAVGNWMVKVPEVDVLFDVKSKTATALLLFVLL